MTLLLGLDIGTTTIKAAAYDPQAGEVTALAARPTPVRHPEPDASEHDPEALWQTAAACLREVAGRVGGHIAGLAVSSFAEAGLPLARDGRPLYPVIAWYDRRPEAQAAWWEQHLPAAELHAITGQRVSPSFGANKWLWIREHAPEAAERMAVWLSVPDYVLWRLTGEQATDYTIASRTLLFDQRALAWSDTMLRLAGLTARQLPQPLPSGTCVGTVGREAAAATGLAPGTPCALGGHDHLCAALAAEVCDPGEVVDSSGTAQAVLSVLPAFRTSPRMAEAGYACYAHVVPGRYVLKAGLKLAGGALEWLARQLAGPGVAPDALPYAELEALARPGVGRRAGPLWLPHWLGSGTPEGDRYSQAALAGLRAEHDSGDLFRGLLESLAFWLRHNLEEVQELSGQPFSQVTLLGGTTRLRLLTELKAAAVGLPMAVPTLPEASATGAALLAGLAVGAFADAREAAGSVRSGREVVRPDPALAAWYDRLYEEAYRPLYPALSGIHRALARLAGHATTEGE
jgi:xylulokinase